MLWIANIPEITFARAERLLEVFGSADEIFGVKRARLAEAAGFSDKSYEFLAENDREKWLETMLDKMEDGGIKYTVSLGSEENFPDNLKNIPSPPLLLYYAGSWETLVKTAAVAIVGTRRPSDYGETAAYFLGQLCGQFGISVVSGMAQGCDSSAQRGCLDANGFTAAVLGTGVDICYPTVNMQMYEEIREKGVLISEFPLGTRPSKWTFPRRNRIISGLSLALIVTEAGERSGALITAEAALEQGVEVFALPGSIFSRQSKGTNFLIKEGANPLTDFDDLLFFLSGKVGWRQFNEEKAVSQVAPLDADERLILKIISKGPITADGIFQKNQRDGVGMTYQKVLLILFNMEVKGYIKKIPGAKYKLTEGIL